MLYIVNTLTKTHRYYTTHTNVNVTIEMKAIHIYFKETFSLERLISNIKHEHLFKLKFKDGRLLFNIKSSKMKKSYPRLS